MIFDHIDFAARYESAHPLFPKAFDALRTMMQQPHLTGRVEVDGDQLFCLVNAYETQPLDKQEMEAHRRYIDIQLMVEGVEKMGIATKDGRPETFAFDAEKDYALFGADCQQFIHLLPGQFAIFFPNDLHMPSLQHSGPSQVRKLVMKVAV